MNRTPPGHWLTRVIAPLGVLLALAGCGGDDGTVSSPPVATYALSGSVAHLEASGLSVSNGSETVAVPAGATSFAFAKPLADGSAYMVTVATQPSGAHCVIDNASGAVAGATVGNVVIACNTLVSQPLSVGVIAAASSGGARIFLPVTQVGTASTTINAILDTGSSGAVLNAFDVFPSAMVTAAGFVFPAGQTSLTYNGITVTNVGATRSYGGGSTVLTGNLGFAQLTVGSGTHVTTALAPILFVYDRKTTVGNPGTSFGNIIGVNPGIAQIEVGKVPASGQPAPCTLRSTASCGLASPLRYLSYADGIDKGFVLGKVTVTDCDAATPGSCPISPNLTIGVTNATMAGFSTIKLPDCGSTTLSAAGSEPVCSQVIPSVTVSSGTDSFTGSMIFDTGTPTTSFLVPPGMTFLTSATSPGVLPTGVSIRVAPTAGFSYQYVTGRGYRETSVAPQAGTEASNSGIGFFTLNSMVLDYSQAIEGWRNS